MMVLSEACSFDGNEPLPKINISERPVSIQTVEPSAVSETVCTPKWVQTEGLSKAGKRVS